MRPPGERWVLASANPGKQREFAALLAPLGVRLELQSALGIEAIEETGDSFRANALLKAEHAARRARLPALADDSGIEVDALGGRPSVHSARYAGPACDDAANNRKLLQELGTLPWERRRARFRCVLALVLPQAPPIFAEGSWEGHIAAAAAGDGGFGYDVVFVPEGMSVTSAQLPAERKNALSHRAAAVRALLAHPLLRARAAPRS